MPLYNIYRSVPPYNVIDWIDATDADDAISHAKRLKIDIAPHVCLRRDTDRNDQPSWSYLEYLRTVADKLSSEKQS